MKVPALVSFSEACGVRPTVPMSSRPRTTNITLYVQVVTRREFSGLEEYCGVSVLTESPRSTGLPFSSSMDCISQDAGCRMRMSVHSIVCASHVVGPSENKEPVVGLTVSILVATRFAFQGCSRLDPGLANTSATVKL